MWENRKKRSRMLNDSVSLDPSRFMDEEMFIFIVVLAWGGIVYFCTGKSMIASINYFMVDNMVRIHKNIIFVKEYDKIII